MTSVIARTVVGITVLLAFRAPMQAQVRVAAPVRTPMKTPVVTLTVAPVAWTPMPGAPFPVSPSIQGIHLEAHPDYQNYHYNYLKRVQVGGQQIWRLVALWCSTMPSAPGLPGVRSCNPSEEDPLMGHVDFPPDVVMKALLDLTPGATGSPIFAFRSVGTLPPNQVRPAAMLRQANMANGQSLALSNGRVLAAADSRLRWLVGAQVLGNWDLNWSRLVLDPSGQVGVLEEIGWKR